MKLKNTSNKIIGIGNVTVLPGETQEIPAAYETSPVLEVYKNREPERWSFWDLFGR